MKTRHSQTKQYKKIKDLEKRHREIVTAFLFIYKIYYSPLHLFIFFKKMSKYILAVIALFIWIVWHLWLSMWCEFSILHFQWVSLVAQKLHASALKF